MIKDLMYIELKTGYSDDGPAWIGYVKTSKTKKTIYFNDHAFQKYNGGYSNYVDIENGDEYWISGLKKRESNRHWDGYGRIMIDRRAVNEYLPCWIRVAPPHIQISFPLSSRSFFTRSTELSLVKLILSEDVIDCYYITVIPTILGSGIRLFEKTDHEIKLRLLKTQSYNGMTDLIYTKR